MQPKVVGREDGPIGIGFKQLLKDKRQCDSQRAQPVQEDHAHEKHVVAPAHDKDMWVHDSLVELGKENTARAANEAEPIGVDAGPQPDVREQAMAALGLKLPLQQQPIAHPGGSPDVRRSCRLGRQKVTPSGGSNNAKASGSQAVGSSKMCMSSVVEEVLQASIHMEAVQLTGASS